MCLQGLAFVKIHDGVYAKPRGGYHFSLGNLPTPPTYLLLPNTISYTLIDENGVESVVEHRRHDFRAMGQRYEKLAELVREFR